MEPTIAPVADEPKKLLSAIELIGRAWKSYNLFSKKIQLLSLATFGLGIILLILVEGGFIGLLFWSSKSTAPSTGLYLVFAALFLLYTLGISFFGATFLRGVADLYQSNFAGVGKTFSKIPKIFWQFFVLNIAFTLIILTGEYLLLIPAIAFGVYLLFSYLVFIVEDKRGFDALLGSWALVKNRWWRVFGKLLLLFLFFVLAIVAIELVVGLISAISFLLLSIIHSVVIVAVLLSLFVLLFAALAVIFVYPFVFLVYYEFYLDLKETKQVVASTSQEKNRKIVLTIFMVLGVLIFFVIFLFANPIKTIQTIVQQQQEAMNQNTNLGQQIGGDFMSSSAAVVPADLQNLAYVSNVGQFQINLPVGWSFAQNDSNVQSGIEAVVNFAPPQGQKSEISISKLDTSFIKTALATSTDNQIALELAKSTVGSMNEGFASEGLDNFALSNLSQVSYSNDTAYVYSGSASSTSPKNTTIVDFKLITIFSGNDGYQILAIWPESEYGSTGTAFQDSLSSFEIVN